MKTIDIAIEKLHSSPWNPNEMDNVTKARLTESISKYGLIQPLVVRKTNDSFEVLSGNQRLNVLREMECNIVPCIVLEIDEFKARLLAQALNAIHGEDDLALKGALLKDILSELPEDEVLSLLPETSESLRSLAQINEMDLAEHLTTWQKVQQNRLQHMQIQLTHDQLRTIEQAVSLLLPKAKDDNFHNPNIRGNAIYLICKYYLERNTPS